MSDDSSVITVKGVNDEGVSDEGVSDEGVSDEGVSNEGRVMRVNDEG